jgi:hypothetical protein
VSTISEDALLSLIIAMCVVAVLKVIALVFAIPSYSSKIAAWRDLREDFARGAWRVDRVGG